MNELLCKKRSQQEKKIIIGFSLLVIIFAIVIVFLWKRNDISNITLVNEDLKMVYHKLFDDSLKKYNAKQKRKDRQIKNYYDKISRSKQEKLFYEVIVQIGNRDDTGVGSDMANIAVKAF